MANIAYVPPRGRAGVGFRGRPVAAPVPQQMMPRGGGRGCFVQAEQSGGGPLTPPPSRQYVVGGGVSSGYPTFGSGDFVKQLQIKIGTLEKQLMLSHVDNERLQMELGKKSQAMEVLTEKYTKLEEEYDAVASYAVTRGGGGNLKDGGEDQDFAQKCIKLEAKIAKSKAISADKEKIKELEEKVGKLEGDKKGLEETFQKQETKLEIMMSVIMRFHGMFKMFAETAAENCNEIEGFLKALSEEGMMTLEENISAARAQEIMEQLAEDSSVKGTQEIMEEAGIFDRPRPQYIFCVESPKSANSDPFGINGRSSGGGSSSVIGGGGEGGNNDFVEDQEEQPPPAAFLDAIKGLTQEDLDELEQMGMELDREVLANANK